jgi:Uma2 family endonuclease
MSGRSRDVARRSRESGMLGRESGDARTDRPRGGRMRTIAVEKSRGCRGTRNARDGGVTSAAILRPMRALLLEPDPKWLEERRRLGRDRFDEVWDGVLHVVPSPNAEHQEFEGDLEAVLRPIVLPQGFKLFHNLDLLDRSRGESDYRQPDIAIVSPADVMRRGINGHAELVIEIRSPNDESYEKLPFYERCGIPEYWIVHPVTREIVVFVLRGDRYVATPPDADGVIDAPRFALRLRVIDGPKLRISWADGSADI